jgi:hypothetical protein
MAWRAVQRKMDSGTTIQLGPVKQYWFVREVVRRRPARQPGDVSPYNRRTNMADASTGSHFTGTGLERWE